MALSQWSQYSLDVLRLHFAPWRFFALALTSRVAVIFAGLTAVVFFDLGIDGFLTAQALVLILVVPLAFWFIRRDLQLSSVNYSQIK